VIVDSAAALVVRSAVLADVERVLDIEAASFADPWTEDAFRSALSLPHMRFLVAERRGVEPERDDGRATGAPGLVGYVLAMVLGLEGEIADIAVAPEARGQGIGGVLLDRVTVGLRQAGVQTLFLEVRESNVAARRLYESRQFGPVGRRRGYYQHPAEDALVLRRDLALA
jgi:[ribosomal protein S18]-alanine N-acetyltransferase